MDLAALQRLQRNRAEESRFFCILHVNQIIQQKDKFRIIGIRFSNIIEVLKTISQSKMRLGIALVEKNLKCLAIHDALLLLHELFGGEGKSYSNFQSLYRHSSVEDRSTTSYSLNSLLISLHIEIN